MPDSTAFGTSMIAASSEEDFDATALSINFNRLVTARPSIRTGAVLSNKIFTVMYTAFWGTGLPNFLRMSFCLKQTLAYENKTI